MTLSTDLALDPAISVELGEIATEIVNEPDVSCRVGADNESDDGLGEDNETDGMGEDNESDDGLGDDNESAENESGGLGDDNESEE